MSALTHAAAASVCSVSAGRRSAPVLARSRLCVAVGRGTAPLPRSYGPACMPGRFYQPSQIHAQPVACKISTISLTLIQHATPAQLPMPSTGLFFRGLARKVKKKGEVENALLPVESTEGLTLRKKKKVDKTGGLKIVNKTGDTVEKALGIKVKKKKKSKKKIEEERRAAPRKNYGEGFGFTGVPGAERWEDFDNAAWQDPEAWRGGILGNTDERGGRKEKRDKHTMWLYRSWGRLEGQEKAKAMRAVAGRAGGDEEWAEEMRERRETGGKLKKRPQGKRTWMPQPQDLYGSRGVQQRYDNDDGREGGSEGEEQSAGRGGMGGGRGGRVRGGEEDGRGRSRGRVDRMVSGRESWSRNDSTGARSGWEGDRRGQGKNDYRQEQGSRGRAFTESRGRRKSEGERSSMGAGKQGNGRSPGSGGGWDDAWEDGDAVLGERAPLGKAGREGLGDSSDEGYGVDEEGRSRSFAAREWASANDERRGRGDGRDGNKVGGFGEERMGVPYKSMKDNGWSLQPGMGRGRRERGDVERGNVRSFAAGSSSEKVSLVGRGRGKGGMGGERKEGGGYEGGVDGFQTWMELRASGRGKSAGLVEEGREIRRREDEGRQLEGRVIGKAERAEEDEDRRGGGLAGQFDDEEEWGEEWEGQGDVFDTRRGTAGGGMIRLQGEAVYGLAPVRAALAAGRRRVHALYVQEGLQEGLQKGKKKDKQGVQWVLRTAQEADVEVCTATKHDLNLLSGNRPHQGFILDASPLEFEEIASLPQPSGGGKSVPPVWLALDEVMDPQNLGAVLRSSHFLGADGVLVCAKNSAPLSAVVAKASAGALEVMPVHSCRNMVRFLTRAASDGWLVVGASSEPSAIPIGELERGYPTILVLGNEGVGLRTNVRRACTHLVKIEGKEALGGGGMNEEEEGEEDGTDSEDGAPQQELVDEDGEGAEDVGHEDDGSFRESAVAGHRSTQSGFNVDSLNVSVAAGIFLHELLTSRTSKVDLVQGDNLLVYGSASDESPLVPMNESQDSVDVGASPTNGVANTSGDSVVHTSSISVESG